MRRHRLVFALWVLTASLAGAESSPGASPLGPQQAEGPREATRDPAWIREGVASWYGEEFHGRTTSNGEQYDMNAFTAAHRTLPFGTRLRVTNLSNGKDVVVRVNDRGPFIAGRIIDLSRAAATFLDMLGSGTARVRLDLIEEPPDKVYIVQIAAFTKEDNALRVQYGLRAAGVEAVLEKTASRVTRVVVDPVAESDLSATLERVARLGYRDCLVREKP